MKKYKFLALACAAILFGACSSEDVVEQGGPNWNAEGQGYIGLSIKLPTQPSTRANDNFDDGTPEEYDVKDATLILFSGGNIVGAYKMTGGFSTDGTPNDNITSTAKITGLVGSQAGYDALVVLNNNGVFTLGDNGAISVGGKTMVGQTLDQFNQAVSDAIGTDYSWHEDGFLMSNAVLATAPGGSTNPTTATAKTLVPIAADAIYDTEAKANSNPAANIYVERAEAKVTLVDAIGSKETTDGTNFEYTVTGWCLDNTNKTNKLVRTVSDFDTWKSYASSLVETDSKDYYRFIGYTEVGKNVAKTETYYRVYWGDDYNYSPTTDGDGLLTVGGETVDDANLHKADGSEAAYCFENTTDFNHMTEENCTRVILKTVFNKGTTFYIVDNDKSTTWTEDALKKEIASRLLNNPEFNEWATQNVDAGNSLESDKDFDVKISEGAGDVTVELITLNADGEAKLKEGYTDFPSNAAALADGEIDIDCYAGGVSYYSVWINHFGEDGTPWTVNDDKTGSSIYPGGAKDYLGRWGVLRNNWYEIQINSISSLGDPTVSTVTGETIDKKRSYVSANINVLSWAKRSQNVDL